MNCSFCSREIPEGTGIIFVKRDGTVYNFCSGKCEKNMLKLKRKASKVKWIVKSKSSRVKGKQKRSKH